jgi:leucyl aminopeptidase
VNARATTDSPAATGADTIVVGVLEGEGIAHDVGEGTLTALLESGEARAAFGHVAVAHAEGRRYVLVGLGDRAALDPERARSAAAAALGRARELSARTLCWELPHHLSDAHAAAFVEGTLLGAYEYRPSGQAVEWVALSAHHDVTGAVERARVGAEAANRARDLQNRPPNVLTPTALADHVAAFAAEHATLSLAVLDRAGIEAAGMGAFAAVARGSHEPPRLITLRYDPPGAAAARVGLVGKAVTFDAGGISLKQPGRMHEMKFDMSGGAAVLEATRAIAELGLPVPLVTVVGATENLPSGHALKPSDVVTAKTGTTIEVVNTDAEGRLVLADCLAHAIEQGAERLVDVATLTGAVVTALGSTYAALLGRDDAWCETVAAAGRDAGELAWRLPLHDDYGELLGSRYADVANASEARKAGTIVGATFLARFTGELPWAHLDVAGVAYDTGRPYAPKGGTGWGVRLLVELAHRLAAS